MATSSGLKRPHPEDLQAEASKRSRSNNGSPVPQPAPNGAGAGRPDVAAIMAEARARAAAAAARLGGIQKPASTSSVASSATSSGASRLEQLKARVTAATKSNASATQTRSTPPPQPAYQIPQYEDYSIRARGGLDVGLHPALMADASTETKFGKGKMQSRFSTTIGNRRSETPGKKAKETKKQLDLSGPSLEEIRSNPYFDASLNSSRSRIPKH